MCGWLSRGSNLLLPALRPPAIASGHFYHFAILMDSISLDPPSPSLQSSTSSLQFQWISLGWTHHENLWNFSGFHYQSCKSSLSSLQFWYIDWTEPGWLTILNFAYINSHHLWKQSRPLYIHSCSLWYHHQPISNCKQSDQHPPPTLYHDKIGVDKYWQHLHRESCCQLKHFLLR